MSSPSMLGAACIDLWLVPVPDTPCAARDEELAATLAPDERERLARFRFEKDRSQYLHAHWALRLLLSLHRPELPPAGWRFVADRLGKPRLAEGLLGRRDALDFNLSHTEGMAAIAISGGEAIGVDVERRRWRHDLPTLFGQCLSEAESARLRQIEREVDRDACFIETWTLKEAYLKACGVGLSRDMRDVELVFDEHDALVSVRDALGAGGPWRFAQGATGDGRFALAVAMPCRRVPPPDARVAVRELAVDGTIVDGRPTLAVRDVVVRRAVS